MQTLRSEAKSSPGSSRCAANCCTAVPQRCRVHLGRVVSMKYTRHLQQKRACTFSSSSAASKKSSLFFVGFFFNANWEIKSCLSLT